MDNNNATEKCNTNLESWEPGLQDRLYLKNLYEITEDIPGVQKTAQKMLLCILSANAVDTR